MLYYYNGQDKEGHTLARWLMEYYLNRQDKLVR